MTCLGTRVLRPPRRQLISISGRSCSLRRTPISDENSTPFNSESDKGGNIGDLAAAEGRLSWLIYVCLITPAKSVICSESLAASAELGPAPRVWAVRSRSSKAIRSLQAAWTGGLRPHNHWRAGRDACGHVGGDSDGASIAGRTPALPHPIHPHQRILAKVIERWFGPISQQAIRGGSFDCVAELERADHV